MEILHAILRWAHVTLGFIGLTAFWFPVFARKGGRLHTRVGKVHTDPGSNGLNPG